MHVTFYGAVREVTGSMHLIGTEQDHILLDCGMYQGHRQEADQKNRLLPFYAGMITNMVLSHAHIDHSGRIPLLVQKGFGGRVVCTRATASAANYLLADSAHIQEQDAQYLNYKTIRRVLSQAPPVSGRPIGKRRYEQLKKMMKKGRQRLDGAAIEKLLTRYDLKGIEPLYTTADADQALAQMDGVPYRHTVAIGQDLSVTFYEAGHILGSAISMIRRTTDGRTRTICYTGDLGRFGKPILRDPCLNFEPRDRHIDLLIMESTYGNREHEPVTDLKPHLTAVLRETFARGGCVLIPSFAFGRTQELLYMIHEIYADGAVERVPVWVDSPLATNLTKVTGEHPEVYDQDTHTTFLRNGKNPFDFQQVHFTTSVEESMALMRETKPHIVISASGMCEAGRILHHLRYKVHNPDNTVLIVGFMAKNTLGRRILEEGAAFEQGGRRGEPPVLKILNKYYPLKAQVVNIGGFSAHADKNEMLHFLKNSGLKIKRVAVVHGEEEQSTAFAALLNQNGYPAAVPQVGQTWVID